MLPQCDRYTRTSIGAITLKDQNEIWLRGECFYPWGLAFLEEEYGITW
jgi:hypothetical protein